MKRIAALFAILIVAGCKEDEAVMTGSIEGKWTGTFAEVQVKPFGLPIPFKDEDASFDTRVEFKPDGTFIVWESGQPVEGSYTLRGEELAIETDYTVEDISFSGTYRIRTLTETTLIIQRKKNNHIIDAEGVPAVRGQIKITLHFSRS